MALGLPLPHGCCLRFVPKQCALRSKPDQPPRPSATSPPQPGRRGHHQYSGPPLPCLSSETAPYDPVAPNGLPPPRYKGCGTLRRPHQTSRGPCSAFHAEWSLDPSEYARESRTVPEDTAFGVDHALVDRVRSQLQVVDRLGVAFSGGVDSSVLLALAGAFLGPARVVAIMGVSPSLASAERSAAHEVARFVGVPLVEVVTNEGERPAYRANGPDRCFHCKDELFTRISDEVVQAHGLTALAYGENADDARRPDRPGSRAATEHLVLRPLADAGLDKAAVRRVARVLRLPRADKPAAPCLAATSWQSKSPSTSSASTCVTGRQQPSRTTRSLSLIHI